MPTTPVTIRTSDPRELLSLVPYQLGFRPADSVVLMGTSGERARVGLTARVDVADLADPDGGATLAADLVAHLRDDGCDAVLLVVYHDEDVRTAPRTSPGRVALRRLEAACRGRLAVQGRLGVTGTGWYDVHCPVTCCPPGGRPLDDLVGTEIGATMVLQGGSYVGSREELGQIPRADADARRAARKAAGRWAARGAAATTSDALLRWRAQGLGLWRSEHRRALDEVMGDPLDQRGPAGLGGSDVTRPSPVVLGRLQAALDDVLVRDAVVLDLVPGSDHVSDLLLAGERGPAVHRALGAITDPEVAVPPDAEWTGAARRVLEAVVAHSPRSRGHAPALTLLGMVAWWHGEGARATVHLEEALASDPDHRMARLVADAVGRGLPPGWVRRASGDVIR